MKYLTTIEAAEILRRSEATLRDWRYKGTGPPFKRIGSRGIFYTEQDLDQWVEDLSGG